MLSDVIDRLAAARPSVIVCGDLMLDRYLHCAATGRLNPEHVDVPILRVDQTEDRLGGAAAVAMLCRGLGADVHLFGAVGLDPAGHALRVQLRRLGIDGKGVLTLPKRPTTVKQRTLLEGRQAGPRLDTEWDADVPDWAADAIAGAIEGHLAGGARPGVLIVADYAKGACPRGLLRRVIAAAAAGVPVLVDPGRGRDWSIYRGAAVIKANADEWDEFTERRDSKPWWYIADRVIVTAGGAGMHLVPRPTDDGGGLIPTRPVKPVDVTGAGDTVAAVLGLCLAAGVDLADGCAIANAAAGEQVSRGPGVVPVTWGAIRENLELVSCGGQVASR